MNHKFKPAAKSDIRERAERKFRARGSLNFHLLLVPVGAVLLIYSLPYLWTTRLYFGGLQYAILLYWVLCTTGALHFIRYHFRHGRGRDRHEAETKARIARQMRGADPDEAEELEELVRLQMDDKLKNKRFAWRHLSLFLGIMSVSMILNLQSIPEFMIWRLSVWQAHVSLAAIWGIGVGAHFLRYYLAYGASAAKRMAQIDAEVARELQRESRRQSDHSARFTEDDRKARLVDSRALAENQTLEDWEPAPARAKIDKGLAKT